jgi:tetratricopeptide (TPR) repeat protein
MHYPTLNIIIKKIPLAVFCTLFPLSFLCAQEQSSASGPLKPVDFRGEKKGVSLGKISPAKKSVFSKTIRKQREENLDQTQTEARLYREEGLSLQNTDDIEGALSLFQKAISLDPAYPVVYNDIGIVYEAMGFPDRAEAAYLKAVKLDPDFLSAYSNLALFYENKRDLEKAEYYWGKRAELGATADPWTEKARKRLIDLKGLRSEVPVYRENTILGLVKDTVKQKTAYQNSDETVFNSHFEKAKESYKKGDEATALREAVIARQFDPGNTEVADFIEKVQKRILTK